MNGPRVLLIPVTLLLAACSREQPAVDPQLAAAIANIKAIDNHAHPVLAAPGDREFDALPVDHMEPQSDPVAMRPGAFKTPFTAESKAAAKRGVAINTRPGCWIRWASRSCWPTASPWENRCSLRVFAGCLMPTP